MLQPRKISNYTLHQHALQKETSTKYLGVTIQNDIKWNKHIDDITSAASKQLNFIKCNLKVNSHAVKEKAYTSIVQPKLEYDSCIWDLETNHKHNSLKWYNGDQHAILAINTTTLAL